MRVGFIGAGRMATTFGRHLALAGHAIVLSNSGDAARLAERVAAVGPGAVAGTKREAVDCDVVILATNWVDVPGALDGLEWRGRILVDGTNAHAGAEPDLSRDGIARSVAALRDVTSSEQVAAMAKGARVVKSISNMPMAWLQDFSLGKPRTVLFVSGDDQHAKEVVRYLIDSAGFAAVDLGGLARGALHQVGAPLSGVEMHFVRTLDRRLAAP